MKNIEIMQVEAWHDELKKDKNKMFLQNALIQNELKVIAINHEKEIESQMCFATEISGGNIMAQKQSGRCWLFSALNVLRTKTIREKNLKSDFAFSPTYLYFWDKLEKANLFLEEVIENGWTFLNTPCGRSKLWYPAGESGQWFMFCNLVKKYGVVPMEVMPETYHSSNSQEMVRYLGHMVRSAAMELLQMKENNLSDDTLRKKKVEAIKKIYGFLCSTLGTPKKSFSYDFTDKDGQYHHIEKITPQEFFKEFWSGELDDYVCVANAPGRQRPYHKTFTLEHFGNVYGGNSSLYYNIEMEEIKPMIVKQLQDGEGIWFGTDCMNMMDRRKGIMSEGLYEYDDLFHVNYKMSKAEMLDLCESSPNHNMVIAGVKEYEDGRRFWKVENSWGCEAGQKGYYIMDEAYLDRYASEFIINKKYLNESQRWELEQEPIVLPYNDPLGA